MGLRQLKQIVLIIGFAIQAKAQTKLNGRVLGLPDRKAIESAYVTVCQQSDSLAVAFTTTSEAGKFSLTFTPQTGQVYFLKISHISYKTVSFLLPINPSETPPSLTIDMEPGSLILKEVQVSTRVAIREQGDSTRYKVDTFRNGSEQTLEEVLKKMPNIRVDDNGDIYFKEKRIDKVFIDGDDLVGNTYQLATRSINPAVLNEVQAIENFSENKLLRKIEQGTQTVLNLAVKDNRKSLLFGMIDAMAGPNYYNGIGNLFSYGKRVKAFAVLSANNTGVRRLDLSDASATVLVDERPATDLLIKPFTQTAQPFLRNLNSPLENLNNEQGSTISIAASPAKTLKITANLSLLRDYVQAGRVQNYQLIGDTPVTYKQTDTLRQKPTLAHLKLQINYDLSPRTMLLYRGVIGTKTIHLQQITQFSTDAQPERFPQQFTNQFSDYWQFLELTRKLNDQQAFVISGQLTNTYLREQYTARINPLLWSAIFSDSLNDGQRIHQQIGQTNQLATIQARWVYGTKIRKFEQQIGFQHNMFAILGEQQSPADNAVSKLLHLNRQTLYSRTSGKLVWSAFELSGHVQIGQAWARLNNQMESHSPIQGNLTATYKVDRLSQFMVAYDRQATFVSNTYLLNTPVITDFRSTQHGETGLIFDVRNQVSLSYLFSDVAYRKMTLLMAIFATRSTRFWNLSNLTLTPDYTLARLINTPNVYTIGATGSLEKLIYPLSGNIRLLINILSNHGIQQINGEERTLSTLTPTVTVKYVSAFNSSFNTDMGLTCTHTALSVVQNKQLFRQQFTNWNGYVQLVFRNKTYQINTTVEGNRIQQNNYLFLKANATYVLTSKLSLKMDAQNLLNQTHYQQRSITSSMYSFGVFPLLPRQVLVGIRYSF